MIDIKDSHEIGVMRVGGKILSEVIREVLRNVRVGISEIELDQLAERLIREKGAEPAFKRVKGYKHTICISTNEIVVHGVPTRRQLKEGDVVGIDGGVYYRGLNTDMAETIKVESGKLRVESSKDEVDRFLETGKMALEEAIKVAKVGNYIGYISKIIQGMIEGAGYSVVRTLVGHGVGRKLHEEPEVPGFVVGKISETPRLEAGMTIAIEVIYNQGSPEIVLADDGWTIKTKDGSLSGLFEQTIAITEKGPVVLTKST